MLVTCKSQVESTQLEEVDPSLYMTRSRKVEAEMKRALKKEEIINEGLQLGLQVKLEFVHKKHEENCDKTRCKWCSEYVPFSKEYCPDRLPGYRWSCY